MSGVYVLVCLLLVLIVLLQQGKGGDIAAAFGGGGTQAAFGARAGATLLTRATTVLGALFMIGALVLAIMGQRGPGSVVGGIDGTETVPLEDLVPATPAEADAPATAPAAETGGAEAPAGDPR